MLAQARIKGIQDFALKAACMLPLPDQMVNGNDTKDIKTKDSLDNREDCFDCLSVSFGGPINSIIAITGKKVSAFSAAWSCDTADNCAVVITPAAALQCIRLQNRCAVPAVSPAQGGMAVLAAQFREIAAYLFVLHI